MRERVFGLLGGMRWLGVGFLLSLFLVGVACGGPSAKPKIGVLLPFTGPLSEFGEAFQKASDLAVEHLKEAGLEVEVVYADTETDAIPGVEAARKLVTVDKVHALVGAASSGVSIPIAQSVSIPNKIPQISYASTSPLITNLPEDQGQDFLFRTAPSDALQGVILGKLAKDQGYNKVGVIYVNNPYGQGLAENFEKSFTAAGGQVVAMVPHDEKAAPTYTSELRKATSGGVDALVAVSYPQHASVYLKEALEGKMVGAFLFVDGTKSQDIISAVGAQNLEGMVGTAPGSAETPGRDTFRRSYQEKYGENPPLPFMENVYDAVVIASLAAYLTVQEGAELTGANLRDRLRTVANPGGEVVGPGADSLKRAVQLLKDKKDINYEGAAGSQDFDENGDVVTPIEIWRYSQSAEGGIETVRLEEP